MGGAREKMIASATPGYPAFRMHENLGEVHIHDDKANRKFACAIAYFKQEWKAGKDRNFSPALTIKGHDGKGNPINIKFEKAISGDAIDVVASFEPMKYGKNLNDIDDFLAGR
jgi:hypothetical protein